MPERTPLGIETAYRRAGFAVAMSEGNNVISIDEAGADTLWTDAEMHDAMQVLWTRFANKPRWSVWTLFASQHAPVPSQGITPTNLGGIMFDDIGPNHRQGTAVFNDSFIGIPPSADPNPAAAVNRIKFWTAVHELGHTFNLAHSWQKALGTGWVPLADEPEARSFMNYPYRVSGRASAFFADFEYRFSDAELLFMRPSASSSTAKRTGSTTTGSRAPTWHHNPTSRSRSACTGPSTASSSWSRSWWSSS